MNFYTDLPMETSVNSVKKSLKVESMDPSQMDPSSIPTSPKRKIGDPRAEQANSSTNAAKHEIEDRKSKRPRSGGVVLDSNVDIQMIDEDEETDPDEVKTVYIVGDLLASRKTIGKKIKGKTRNVGYDEDNSDDDETNAANEANVNQISDADDEKGMLSPIRVPRNSPDAISDAQRKKERLKKRAAQRQVFYGDSVSSGVSSYQYCTTCRRPFVISANMQCHYCGVVQH